MLGCTSIPLPFLFYFQIKHSFFLQFLILFPLYCSQVCPNNFLTTTCNPQHLQPPKIYDNIDISYLACKFFLVLLCHVWYKYTHVTIYIRGSVLFLCDTKLASLFFWKWYFKQSTYIRVHKTIFKGYKKVLLLFLLL